MSENDNVHGAVNGRRRQPSMWLTLSESWASATRSTDGIDAQTARETRCGNIFLPVRLHRGDRLGATNLRCRVETEGWNARPACGVGHVTKNTRCVHGMD